MKDIWTAIWLSENSTGQKTSDFLRTLLPNSSPKSTKGNLKFAIVVGHNKKRPGAYAPHPIYKSEFAFNTEVAKAMVKLANLDPTIEVKVFYRKPMNSYYAEIDDVYRRVNKWEPHYALELHFNWLNQAGRVEMAHSPTSDISKALANSLLKTFSRLMRTVKVKLLPRGKSDRGGRSLWACKCPIVLTEPFDCSNTEHLIRVSEIGPEVFADVYLKTLKTFATKYLT